VLRVQGTPVSSGVMALSVTTASGGVDPSSGGVPPSTRE